MGKRKQSPTQILISIGMGADEAALSAAIDTLAGIRDHRFPKAKAKPPRASRSDKGTTRQSHLNPPLAGEEGAK